MNYVNNIIFNNYFASLNYHICWLSLVLLPFSRYASAHNVVFAAFRNVSRCWLFYCSRRCSFNCLFIFFKYIIITGHREVGRLPRSLWYTLGKPTESEPCLALVSKTVWLKILKRFNFQSVDLLYRNSL